MIDAPVRAAVKQAAMDRKSEILAKLEQIQDQAQLTLDELPLRLAKDRLRLIIGLARYLSTAVELLEDDLQRGGQLPRAGDREAVGFDHHLSKPCDPRGLLKLISAHRLAILRVR